MADTFINNDYRIVGTIYDIQFQEISGVKDPSAKYQKYIVTLEVKKSREIGSGDHKRWVDVTELPQFEAFAMNLDEFSKGDYVQINFYLSGKEWANKTTGKKGIMTKNCITFMKFADIDAGTGKRYNKPVNANTTVPKANEMTRTQDWLPDPDKEELDALPF